MRVPVFIAGPSAEALRVRAFAAQLKASGLVRLTDRWFDTAHQWSGKDGERTVGEQREIGCAHEDAIREARIVWVLWPRVGSHGAAYELGYARAQGTARVVVSGRGCSRCLYTAMANFRDESDDVGLYEVLRFAGRLRVLEGGVK